MYQFVLSVINIKMSCPQSPCSINKVAVSIAKFSTSLEVLLAFGLAFVSLNAETTNGVGKEFSRINLCHEMKL